MPPGLCALARDRRGGRLGVIGVGVAGDPPILEGDDAGGVALGKLRVVGDHDDQPVLRHLPEQLHDLDGGLAVQRAGGLVRQENVRVVDEGAGDGHPLHLAAGHLAGLFIQLVAQAHPLQRLLRPAAALRLGYPRQGQRQLHVGQHRLVGDEVIALEHKAHRVVAVGVPVAVPVLFCGAAVDDEIAAGVAVKSADDVQRGGLAAAGGAQNGDELILPELQIDAPQGLHRGPAHRIAFVDVR